MDMWDEIDQLCYEKGLFEYCKIQKRPRLLEAIKEYISAIDGTIYIPMEGIDKKDAQFVTDILCRDIRDRIIVGKKHRTNNLAQKILKKLSVDGNHSIDFILNLDIPNAKKSRIISMIRRIVHRCKGSYLPDVLAKEGLISYEYGRVWDEISITAKDVWEDGRTYEKAKTKEEQLFCAKRLFGDCVFIKDFINAEHWLKVIAQLSDSEGEIQQYKATWSDIQHKLDDLKKTTNGKDHIVVNWIDNVRYSEADRMPFVYSLLNKGISFDKMYTTTPYTWGTMRTIMTDRYLIDDEMFRYFNDDTSDKGFSECRLIRILEENDYEFACVSPHFLSGFFANEHIRTESLLNAHVPSTMIQFEALRVLSKINRKCLIIVHNLNETHFPYYNPISMYRTDLDSENGYKPDIREKTLWQEGASKKYLDDQLKYFSEFYDKSKYRIYLSDHGQIRWEDGFCLEEKYHILFGVISRDYDICRHITRISSIKEFCDIIQKCLHDEIMSFEINSEDFIWIQHDDIYDYSMYDSIKRKKQLNNREQYLQSRGVVTSEDAYIRLAIGKEYYYLDKEKKNRIGEEQYQDRIGFLRQKAGSKFINIKKESKYAAARELYDLLQLSIPEDTDFI